MDEQIKKEEVNLRCKLADNNLKHTIVKTGNKDKEIKNYVGVFTKSFEHNEEGYVNKKEYQKFLKWLTEGGDATFTLGGKMKLIDPSCIRAMELFGQNAGTFKLKKAPRLKSRRMGQEMLELYAMALLRDIPLNDYTTNSYVDDICQELSTLNKTITPKILFRGNTKGDLKGPYISQFLYHSYKYGPAVIDQKYVPEVAKIDYMTTYDNALSVQDGVVNEEKVVSKLSPRYLMTLRDGAAYVKEDFPAQPAMNAALILLKLKVPFNKLNPYNDNGVEAPFVDFGIVDILDLINRVTRYAMLVCWNHKWDILKLRPEAVGMEVHKALVTGDNEYCLHRDLLKSQILKRIYDKYDSYLLPQAYPEGSPCHPSYPSGHAILAGATVTIVKAFFDCSSNIPAYIPSADGKRLIALDYELNVNDELDKLASNIPSFRNAAGIHYRSDARGVELGETVAIEFLKEHVKRYNHKSGFLIKKRDGETIKIS